MTGGSQTIETCVERVLQSKTFRNSPSSRRLLKYLSEHSLAGDSEQLKEYTIGIDAFGKPADYDPRVDSTVRIQIGRLRQKLAEYYRDEGHEDPVIVDLPKGHFSLTCESRGEAAAPPPAAPARMPWKAMAVSIAALWLATAAFAVWKLKPASSAASAWTPELAELWSPFVTSKRPLLVVVGNPLFLQFENKVLYRDLSIENPDDLLRSQQLAGVRKALGGLDSRLVHYYAAVGDVTAAFQLGQRLGPQQSNISIVRSSQLQWQQMADANVLFLGPPRFFGDKLNNLPAALEIVETPDGFRVVHPKPGESSLYKFRDPAGYLAEDGEACVLVTRTAGPAGNTDVLTFASNSTFGRAGAVSALTDAAFAKTMVARMRGPSGHVPRYFQALLEVKYKGGVATDTTFLLYRELQRRN